ncbi:MULTISPECIES: flagellar protein FlaG [Hydrocarboniphaga]|uniref:flagellar protein FlaG n=1 Tax=Hydrocarboniphaga TaxID=243627 RepID=UPI000A03A03E|nr:MULTISPECIES: flagellar protein FlaG [Hydrocarboniphaga]MDZ4080791.1 flagellar protein FlaG [Hydrocarboniphaga sp.]MDZ4080898.1 flagellar protein FlaG [Hydrocarboniphaga sp.]
MPITSATSHPAATPVAAGFRALSPLSGVDATQSVRADGDEAAPRQNPDASEPALHGKAERDALEQAAEALTEHFQLRQVALHFSVDEDSDRLVVKVVDTHDGTLIRQIPSEEALRLAQGLHSETPPLLDQIV